MSTRFPAVPAAVLVALVPAARAAAAIICANPAGGSPEGLACHTTIQAAVDAAHRPTDVIRVTAGVYHEVVVPPFKNGLQIVGDDGATTILDVPEGQPFGITAMSSDIQIRTLTILNREVGVTLQAPRVHGPRTSPSRPSPRVTKRARPSRSRLRHSRGSSEPRQGSNPRGHALPKVSRHESRSLHGPRPWRLEARA